MTLKENEIMILTRLDIILDRLDYLMPTLSAEQFRITLDAWTEIQLIRGENFGMEQDRPIPDPGEKE